MASRGEEERGGRTEEKVGLGCVHQHVHVTKSPEVPINDRPVSPPGGLTVLLRVYRDFPSSRDFAKPTERYEN